MTLKSQQHAFSLIELILFIVVMGILGVGIMNEYVAYMHNAHTPAERLQAVGLAKKRMEIISQDRQSKGFANFSDPCLGGTPPAACTDTLTGYTVASSITTTSIGDGLNKKIIVVTVSGKSDASLTTEAMPYD